VEIIGERYALLDVIARGGYARVYLGRLLGLGGFSRTVAVKRLRSNYVDRPEHVGMLLDEARIVARVQHANVVQTLDVVRSGDELFLVMEYVHGDTLSHLAAAARASGACIPQPIAASIVAGVLHGLHAAHIATAETGEPLGIIHRDVSPENVLVGADGVARIGDFGVARAGRRVHTTRQGKVQGKLPYMAPEQLLGRSLDARTDVYAAAVVLWEGLTNSRLFGGDNNPGIMPSIVEGHIPRPSEIEPSVPGPLDAIVMNGLALDPANRFASAHDMALALEAFGTAPVSEVSAWVQAIGRERLSERSQRIAQIESQFASDSLHKAVAVIEQLQSPSPASEAPTLIEHPKPAPGIAAGRHAMDRETATIPEETRPRDTTLAEEPSVSRRVATFVGAALVAGFAAAAALHVHGGRGGARSPATALPAASIATAASAPPEGAALAMPEAPVESACPGDMIAIPGGEFFMGRDDGSAAERPEHHVTLDAFCIDRTEVTVADYAACSDTGQCKRAPTTNWWPDIAPGERAVFDPVCNGRDPAARAHHPVNCVDWETAGRYCAYRGRRLPTEAEWEFAARGPDGRHYPWGDEAPTSARLNACGRECLAWGKVRHVDERMLFSDSDGFAGTAPVGSFPKGKSPFGLEDVAGNVWEWVADFYGAYEGKDQANPSGPASGSERVVRGGSWSSGDAWWPRATFRYKRVPGTRTTGIGFRCAAAAGASR
jgi:serine/threonine-protein kinase